MFVQYICCATYCAICCEIFGLPADDGGGDCHHPDLHLIALRPANSHHTHTNYTHIACNLHTVYTQLNDTNNTSIIYNLHTIYTPLNDTNYTVHEPNPLNELNRLNGLNPHQTHANNTQITINLHTTSRYK